MEIEIDETDMARIFIVSHFGQETEETIPANIDSLSKRILQFYG